MFRSYIDDGAGVRYHLVLNGASGFNEQRGIPDGGIICPCPDLLTNTLCSTKCLSHSVGKQPHWSGQGVAILLGHSKKQRGASLG